VKWYEDNINDASQQRARNALDLEAASENRDSSQEAYERALQAQARKEAQLDSFATSQFSIEELVTVLIFLFSRNDSVRSGSQFRRSWCFDRHGDRKLAVCQRGQSGSQRGEDRGAASQSCSSARPWNQKLAPKKCRLENLTLAGTPSRRNLRGPWNVARPHR
jgi:hypothetical protein